MKDETTNYLSERTKKQIYGKLMSHTDTVKLFCLIIKTLAHPHT